MFESLTQRLSGTLQRLRGRGRLTEENIREATREVRIALLEADVALPVVSALIERIKVRAVGQEVLTSLTPGQALIKVVRDEMAAVMARLKDRRFEVIGHTDADGARPANVSLSLARAQAVKTYLTGKGLPADRIAISGMGPDQPVASNATEAGRARNRRIEFRVGS